MSSPRRRRKLRWEGAAAEEQEDVEGAALVLAFWDDAEAAAAEEELEAAALLLALWDDADAEAAAAEELELEDAVFFSLM